MRWRTISKRVKIEPNIVNYCMFTRYATNSKACNFVIHKYEPSDSEVKGLNDFGTNKRRIHLIRNS